MQYLVQLLSIPLCTLVCPNSPRSKTQGRYQPHRSQFGARMSTITSPWRRTHTVAQGMRFEQTFFQLALTIDGGRRGRPEHELRRGLPDDDVLSGAPRQLTDQRTDGLHPDLVVGHLHCRQRRPRVVCYPHVVVGHHRDVPGYVPAETAQLRERPDGSVHIRDDDAGGRAVRVEQALDGYRRQFRGVPDAPDEVLAGGGRRRGALGRSHALSAGRYRWTVCPRPDRYGCARGR